MQTTSLFRRAAALALTLVLAVSASLAGFATYDMPIQTVSDTESVYLFNLDTGKPILDQNAGQSRYIASLTKMMTALLFLESGKDLNEEITIPTSLTQEFKDIQNANGSTINLRIGETVRRIDLLYGLLVASANDAASVIAACKAIAPTFGGINLEDIKSPECFEIEETLEKELDIPVFHDDQHGTAIVVTAALINALRVVGKKMEDVHIVLNGPGAAGTAIIKMLMTAGAKDIIAVDQFGTLYKGCNSAEAHKNWLGEVTNPRQIKGGLKEAIAGADVFIGVSKPGILTTELCRTMNKDAIVFAMANPTPEIMPDEAKAGGVRVMATGRSDFPNQVNNVLCFPGLFKGALSVRARDINNEMKLAAAYAIADLITDADRSEENIIPGAFDPRVAEAVANAVAKAARETGVARL